jgi:hypothetical protein
MIAIGHAADCPVGAELADRANFRPRVFHLVTMTRLQRHLAKRAIFGA